MVSLLTSLTFSGQFARVIPFPDQSAGNKAPTTSPPKQNNYQNLNVITAELQKKNPDLQLIKKHLNREASFIVDHLNWGKKIETVDYQKAKRSWIVELTILYLRNRLKPLSIQDNPALFEKAYDYVNVQRHMPYHRRNDKQVDLLNTLNLAWLTHWKSAQKNYPQDTQIAEPTKLSDITRNSPLRGNIFSQLLGHTLERLIAYEPVPHLIRTFPTMAMIERYQRFLTEIARPSSLKQQEKTNLWAKLILLAMFNLKRREAVTGRSSYTSQNTDTEHTNLSKFLEDVVILFIARNLQWIQENHKRSPQ